jgi:CheY-like chemotaxis protein
MDAALPMLVRADGKRLQQVLLNLLGNAVKFTAHGEVRLGVRVVPVPGAATGARTRLCFWVEDTGIGITQDQQAAIFRAFEQGADVQRRYGGTGLGLAISQQLVNLMGGQIAVESPPTGQAAGSRFWFELDLPVAHLPAAEPVLLRATRPSGYAGRRRKILVVDDVAANRRAVVDYLEPLGFEMHQAIDGESGLERAQALRPDLILMDNVMPGIDGREATRRLRRDADLRTVPVIAVSASASAEDQQRSLESGANAFLPKPVVFDHLLDQIESLLGLKWSLEGSERGER